MQNQFFQNQNKGGHFVHHRHAAADMKSIQGACVCGPLCGCTANDKTRQIKCLLRRTSSAWQDDGEGVMGKERRSILEEFFILWASFGELFCLLEQCAATLQMACQGKLASMHVSCRVHMFTLSPLRPIMRLWRCRAGEAQTKGISPVEQMGSGVTNVSVSVGQLLVWLLVWQKRGAENLAFEWKQRQKSSSHSGIWLIESVPPKASRESTWKSKSLCVH